MGGKNLGSTACSVCQRFGYRRCRKDACGRHFARPFSSRALAPYSLVLLLTAIVICTKCCYLLTFAEFTPTALVSAEEAAYGTRTEKSQSIAEPENKPVGQKKQQTAGQEDESDPNLEVVEDTDITSESETSTTKHEHHGKVHPTPNGDTHTHAQATKEEDGGGREESLGWPGHGAREEPLPLQKESPFRLGGYWGKRPELSVGHAVGDKNTSEEKEQGVHKTEKNEGLTEVQKGEKKEGKVQSGHAGGTGESKTEKDSERKFRATKSSPSPSAAPKESSSDKKLDNCDDVCWCEGIEEGEEEKSVVSVSRHLRGTDAFLSSFFARPFFTFPFYFSPLFEFDSPIGVHSSGACRFTFTLGPKVPFEEARLYALPSQRLVVLAADRTTKHTEDCKTFHGSYGERAQSHAVAVVPGYCILSEELVRAGVVAWSCAGKTSAGSRKILVTFPSKAHATELLEKKQVTQEAYDVLFEKGDPSRLPAGEKCLLSGRTESECDRVKEEVCKEKEIPPSFSSDGYSENELKIPRFSYA